ncbi:MAG: energy transducer TonB, partial [Pseudomonadota bacterium]
GMTSLNPAVAGCDTQPGAPLRTMQPLPGRGVTPARSQRTVAGVPRNMDAGGPGARMSLRRAGPFGAILMAHAFGFYALQGGMAPPVASMALPREVFATFIPETTARALPRPAAAIPEAASVASKPVMTKSEFVPAPALVTPPPVATAPATVTATAKPTATIVEQPAPATAAPPSASSAPAVPRTVSSGIEYLRPPRLDYPALSRRLGEEGNIVLRVLVNELGYPERIEVQQSSGRQRLDEAARQALSRAIFKPFTEAGQAVAAYALVPVKFHLDN